MIHMNAPRKEDSHSKEKWGSVRKIRFRRQIISLIDFALDNNGKSFAIEDLQGLMIKARKERETLRMQATQQERMSLAGSLRKATFRSLALDSSAFAKGIGIFDIVDGKVKASKEASEIAGLVDEDIKKAESMLIHMILKSKYKVYIKFLETLQMKNGSLFIPAEFSRRERSSARFLTNEGFMTDVPSFYAIRDLFYEFGLINWNFSTVDGSEHIFMTSAISKVLVTGYSMKCRLNAHFLFYDKVIGIDNFGSIVVDQYLKQTGDRWGIVVDIVSLRNQVAETLRISDQQFNQMIIELQSRWTDGPTRVALSQGIIFPSVRTGYLIKAINLPELPHGLRVGYIRLSRN